MSHRSFYFKSLGAVHNLLVRVRVMGARKPIRVCTTFRLFNSFSGRAEFRFFASAAFRPPLRLRLHDNPERPKQRRRVIRNDERIVRLSIDRENGKNNVTFFKVFYISEKGGYTYKNYRCHHDHDHDINNSPKAAKSKMIPDVNPKTDTHRLTMRCAMQCLSAQHSSL